eukprot:2576725-Rhodomonas_salina.1
MSAGRRSRHATPATPRATSANRHCTCRDIHNQTSLIAGTHGASRPSHDLQAHLRLSETTTARQRSGSDHEEEAYP